MEYVRLLHLAASTMETEVEHALALLLAAGTDPTADQVRLVLEPVRRVVPELAAAVVNLAEYDELLGQVREVVS